MKIILAIPAYNCSEQLKRILERIDDSFVKNFSEIIVVNDCSTDDTLKTALQFKPKISKLKVLNNKENYNLGGFHKIIFQYALKEKIDYVVVLHGDDQAKLNESLGLVEAVKKGSYDAVLGSRFMRGSKLVNYDKKRIFGNLVLNKIYTVLTGKKVLDLGSGLNIYRIGLFKNNDFLSFRNDLTFNLDLLLYLIKNNKNILYVPITWEEKDQVSNAKIFRIGWIALMNIIYYRLGIAKPVPEEKRFNTTEVK